MSVFDESESGRVAANQCVQVVEVLRRTFEWMVGGGGFT